MKQHGFSIIEFIVSMLLLVVIFGIVFSIFVPVAKSAKVESKNIQTQIEGVIGLEILRRDIVHSGVGLPWTFPAGFTYTETNASPQNAFNNPANAVPIPLRVLNGDSTVGPPPVAVTGSDYLVLRSTVIADTIQVGSTATSNPVVDRWTTVYNQPAAGTVRLWGSAERDPITNDRVMVIQPFATTGPFLLQTTTTGGTTTWFTTVQASNPKIAAGFAPPTANQIWYAYGLSNGSDPAMPFHRADYYLSSSNVPGRCAGGTGVLVKRLLRQNNNFADELPLLDCVADFQIVLGVDNQANGISQRNCLTNPTDQHMAFATLWPTVAPPDASTMRTDLKEVRIYILVQEGSFDGQYKFPSSTIKVGETNTSDCGTGTASCNCTIGVAGETDNFLGRQPDFNLTTIARYQNYRWRVYKMVVKPEGFTTTAAQ